MSVLIFHDTEGDEVAVDSAAITMVRVGRVADLPDTWTLVTVIGATVAVREPLAGVLALWRAARPDGGYTRPPSGWKFHDVVKGSSA